ncbi:YoaP domain-containing protein [Candidatus Omnitrophota bacterium]
MDKVHIINTHADNILDFGICGYKNIKRPGYPEKIEWLKNRFREGLKVKTLFSEKDGTQGMIEYIPGEYCWRPVEANGYMFIHCIFSGFKREYKGKGYGSLLLDECLNDAREGKKFGTAVVTRKSSFMAGKELFLKKGFEIVDKAPSDFELLVKKIDQNAPSPKFRPDREKRLQEYRNGLTIIRADQCPYTVKNVQEICQTAKIIYGIQPHVIHLNNCREAQNCPCPFGTFCMVYNGKIIAEHPVSNTRFKNIMNREMNM